jgi:hypothetical protein
MALGFLNMLDRRVSTVLSCLRGFKLSGGHRAGMMRDALTTKRISGSRATLYAHD